MFDHRSPALGAGAQRLGCAEIDWRLIRRHLGRVAEVEAQLPLPRFIRRQRQLGAKRPARLGPEALQRADAVRAQQRLHLARRQHAAPRRFADGKTTARTVAVGARAGVAPVVLLDHAAALRTGCLQRGIVPRHAVAVVFLGLAHDALGHRGDLAHKGVAAELPALHLRQLVLPLARELGPGELLHPQPTQQGHELKGLGRRHQLAPITQQVFFGDQPFDDGRTRGRRAQPLVGHRAAQLLVFDQLARAFHRRQQRGFVVARRRPGLLGVQPHVLHRHALARLHRWQPPVALTAVFGLGFAPIDGHPARIDQHFALGLEVVHRVVHGHPRDARGDQKLGRREEHGDEAPHHQVVELLLRFAQALWQLGGGNDGEVVADFGVVEHPLGGAHPAVVQRRARVRRQVRQRAVGQHLQRLPHRAQVVLGQRARVRTRVGQHLVLFVQALRQRQRRLGRKAKAPIGLALQTGQVVQQAAGLGAGLGFLRHLAAAPLHGGRDGTGARLLPQALGARLRVGAVALRLAEGWVEPAPGVGPGGSGKGGVYLPVVTRLEAPDLLFALDDDGQRRCLHPPHRGEEKTAIARIERRHGARAVDADQPVRFGAAARGISQRPHLLVAAQLGKAVADGLRRHRLQPQPPHRLAQRLGLSSLVGAARVLLDEAKDQLAFTPGVTGVDQCGDIFAPCQLDNGIEPPLGLVQRLEVEVRRYHRQVRKAPLAAFDLVAFGCGDLQQVADRRGDDVALVFVVLVVLVKLAGHRSEGAHDVERDRGLFGDNQHLAGAGEIVGQTWGLHLYNAPDGRCGGGPRRMPRLARARVRPLVLP